MSVVDMVLGAMSSGAGQYGPDVTPGAVAAWALTFHHDRAGELGDPILSIGSDTYDGSISASLPDQLAGGTYEVVVEGMTDEDYRKIRLGPGDPIATKLHLWWKDSPSGVLGDLAGFTGFTDPLGAVSPTPPEHSLVAVLRLTKLSRRAGERRYEAVMTLTERVFARLSAARVAGACYDDLVATSNAIAAAAGITITQHGLDRVTAGPGQPAFASTSPGTALQALTASGSDDSGLIGQVRRGIQAYGLDPAIIRDGTLHVGLWSDPSFAARTLDEAGGLVKAEVGSPRPRDPRAGAKPDWAPTARDTVTLTSLGRPDLKPGDTVSVVLPPEDFPNTAPADVGSALLTAATGFVTGSFTDEPSGPPKRCLVTEVAHRVSRRAGFVTVAHALVLESEADFGWDQTEPGADTPASASSAPRAPASTSADAAVATARRIHEVSRPGAAPGPHRIAQVRSHQPSDGSSQSPKHTSTVWYSDVQSDGRPAFAQRVPITELHHGVAQEVPVLSPFAWGSYGLALPRYPGTRVLLASVAGSDDLVDVGAVWERNSGPSAEAGDWWLVLPIGMDPRVDIGESDGQATDGAATHDLIDGDGTRILETKRFVVRVTDEPTDSSGRPVPGDDAPPGSVLIEAKSSGSLAQIVLKDDGSITVTGTSITFDTAGHGDIELKANNVKVTVTGTMDVS